MNYVFIISSENFLGEDQVVNIMYFSKHFTKTLYSSQFSVVLYTKELKTISLGIR